MHFKAKLVPTLAKIPSSSSSPILNQEISLIQSHGVEVRPNV